MPIKKRTQTRDGIFLVDEIRYDSGLVEISIKTGEVIAGAGDILHGVISKQPVENGKWVGHTKSRNRVAVSAKKRTAIGMTIEAIMSELRRDGSVRFYAEHAGVVDDDDVLEAIDG